MKQLHQLKLSLAFEYSTAESFDYTKLIKVERVSSTNADVFMRT